MNTSIINHIKINRNFLDHDLLMGVVWCLVSGGIVVLSEISFIVKNPDQIFFILPISSIAAILLRPPAACRRFSPDQGDRRLAAKPVMFLIILINSLCARFTSLFKSGSFLVIGADPFQVFLPGVCSVDPFLTWSMACGRVFCGDWNKLLSAV